MKKTHVSWELVQPNSNNNKYERKKRIIPVERGGGGRGYDSGKFTAWDSKEVTEEERAARERVQY